MSHSGKKTTGKRVEKKNGPAFSFSRFQFSTVKEKETEVRDRDNPSK